MQEDFWRSLKTKIELINTIVSTRNHSVDSNNINTNKILIDSDFKNESINTIAKIISDTTSYYHEIIYTVIQDMIRCEFEKTSSVNSRYLAHLSSHYQQYQLFSKVDLLTHTTNVVIETILLSKELPDRTRALQLILALTHDFGKSDKIVQELGITNSKTPHHEISSKYLTAVCSKCRGENDSSMSSDATKLLSQVLYLHHASKEIREKNANIYLNLLVDADFKARDKEMLMIFNMGKKK